MCTTCDVADPIIRTLIDDADNFEQYLASLQVQYPSEFWPHELMQEYRSLRLHALAARSEHPGTQKALQQRYEYLQQVARTKATPSQQEDTPATDPSEQLEEAARVSPDTAFSIDDLTISSS